jgi:hypothetical protein
MHKQYKTEIKYTLNQYFYKLLETMRKRGTKIIVETDKFKQLGQIAMLSEMIAEIEETDGQISSDAIF